MKYEIVLKIVDSSHKILETVKVTRKTGGLTDTRRLIEILDAIYFKVISKYPRYHKAVGSVQSKDGTIHFWRSANLMSDDCWTITTKTTIREWLGSLLEDR